MRTNRQVKKINIAYIGGGSRGWAWGFMSDLASETGLSGTVRLYDIDNEAAKSNEIIGNMIRQDYPDMAQWAYQQVDSLEKKWGQTQFFLQKHPNFLLSADKIRPST